MARPGRQIPEASGPRKNEIHTFHLFPLSSTLLTVQYAIILALLLIFVFGLGLLARRLAIPYPILFVIGGLFIGYIPDLPHIKLDPDMIFFIVLPPLLYIQALNTSWRDFCNELRPILLLAIGLVIVTTLSIAYFAHWLIPDFPAGSGPFPLAAGIVLGAIISPPDSIAVAAIAERLGLPRRTTTTLEGESLVNDATSLVIFQMAMVAILKPGAHADIDVWAVGHFLYVALGGIALGVGVGWVIARVQRHIVDDGPEILLTMSLLTPFASYLAGQALHVSSVMAVVSTGLYLGRRTSDGMNPVSRLRARAFWEAIVYLLNGIVFVLIGLQLPRILENMREHWWPRPFLYAVAITLACIVIRMVWVFIGAWFLHRISRHHRKRESSPPWRQVCVVGWAGMRGVVSLAAALALNGYPEFPRGHLVQFIAFSVILGTLVFQGLTLPILIRFLGLADDGIAVREEKTARHLMNQAILKKIEEERTEKKYPEDVLDEMEHFYRAHHLEESDESTDHAGHRHHYVSRHKLQHTLIVTGRHTLLRLRHDGQIGDDILHKIEHELDLEEARLKH